MVLTNYRGWDFFVARGPKPLGLVLIHEIFGYNDYIEAAARNLAAAGFTAAAIDLFRGKRTTNREEDTS